jgi:predicted HNH restriction endonuclease
MGMAPAGEGQSFPFMARGYTQAMHGLCLSCHQRQGEETGRRDLYQCDNCHHQVHHETDELISR